MLTYCDPIEMDNCEITAQTLVYLVRVNSKEPFVYALKGLDQYYVEQMDADPISNAKEYWLISPEIVKENISNPVIFVNNVLNSASLTEEEVIVNLGFNPRLVQSKQFEKVKVTALNQQTIGSIKDLINDMNTDQPFSQQDIVLLLANLPAPTTNALIRAAADFEESLVTSTAASFQLTQEMIARLPSSTLKDLIDAMPQANSLITRLGEELQKRTAIADTVQQTQIVSSNYFRQTLGFFSHVLKTCEINIRQVLQN